MNKLIVIPYKKATVIVCLFLCLCVFQRTLAAPSGPVDQWQFDPATQKAYDLVLNLQVEEAYKLLGAPETAQQLYVSALAEAIELLITENGEKYTEYEDRFIRRLERKTKTNLPDDLFLQAEIRLQWAFVYLKFGHEFDAALNLRQAYITVQEIKSKFPSFQAIKKTSGLLEIIIGSVPQKYNWILSLLNLSGSTNTGFEELESIRLSGSSLAFEADLIHVLIQGFLLQQPGSSVKEVKNLLTKYPSNRLLLFLGSALAIKDAQSEEALLMLDTLRLQSEGLPLHYADYLRGEVYLFKGDYLSSIASYRWFVNNYQGQNCIKDSYYKIGLCYWLNGNVNDAQTTFKQAKISGKEVSESDKYAARSLSEDELPHIKLTKARYATDGGYYDQADEILKSISPDEIKTKRDEVEFYYRKARLSHKQNDVANAKQYYQNTIDLNGYDDAWYYAPNACLQLGYIFLNESNDAVARNYFNKALSYNKHEYKNSIDSKAKSALAHMKPK